MQTSAFENARAAFFSSLNNPTEIASDLQAASIKFDAALLNDVQNLSAYANDPTRAAINLGVYLADLNYCLGFGKSAQTKTLFEAARELSQAIGVEQKILDFLMTRYQDHLQQNDSVKQVLLELYTQSTIKLEGTERERHAAYIMAGYQIETLHLLLSILESASLNPSNTKLYEKYFQTVVNSRAGVSIMYAYLRNMADPLDPERNPNYLHYTNAFEELLATYERVQPGSDLAPLKEKVEVIRTRMVAVK